ncbi:LacI family DNA-binding transcriptional regulator [Cellulomonas soli]
MARAAGVSIAVVSYALNGRPGVSAATRERVLRVADEFGWRPSAAARSLRTGPRTIGLVVDRCAASSAHATALLDLVTALQDVVAARGFALMLQVVDDAHAAVALYGSWWAERRFDVMVVTDVLAQDPRIDALRRLRAPAVVVGPPQGVHELAGVHVDEDDAYRRIGRYLLELGHRDVAAITGPETQLRTRARVAALRAVVDPAGGLVVHEPTTSTPEAAAVATRRLLTSPPRRPPWCTTPTRWPWRPSTSHDAPAVPCRGTCRSSRAPTPRCATCRPPP